MSDQRIDTGFLSGASVRLSRLLGLSGQVSPRFDPTALLQPSLNIADATGPGMDDERHFFSLGYGGAACGGITLVSNPNSRGFVIEQLVIGCNTAPTSSVWWQCVTAATVAATYPGILAISTVPFADRRITTGDICAIGSSQYALGGNAIPAGNVNAGCATVSLGVTLVVPVRIMIAPECGFILRVVGALTSLDVSVSGRMF
jgi:hypothetical protein